ncbi:MAG: ABC transporter substrate-binding protein [Defluviitaleaceae bacterium]|nr:ABC transporter substrate-binding protein [Defluviitaleaceae bacterium]
MKKLRILAIGLMASILLAACGNREGQVEAEGIAIISLAPSNTEIIAGLGLASNLIAIDNVGSADVEGVPAGLTMFSIFGLDVEALIALEADYIVALGSFPGDTSPLTPLYDISTVVYVQSATSIADIVESIQYIGDALGASSYAEALISKMMEEMSKVEAIVEGITTRPTVYFEVDPTYLFTTGAGTFFNELINLAGGINAFGDLTGWAPLSSEAVLYANPDVIISNAGWMPDVLELIANRPGWHALDAIEGGRLYLMSTDITSRQSQNIAIALKQLAAILHPEYFNE